MTTLISENQLLHLGFNEMPDEQPADSVYYKVWECKVGEEIIIHYYVEIDSSGQSGESYFLINSVVYAFFTKEGIITLLKTLRDGKARP